MLPRNPSAKELEQARRATYEKRTMLGPRGSFDKAASPDPDFSSEEVKRLVRTGIFSTLDRDLKNEIVKCAGEWGGTDEAKILLKALRSEMEYEHPDEKFLGDLVSALTSIAGPEAIAGLFHAAENGSQWLRLSALAGLESLASDGTTSMMEAPLPTAITSEEQCKIFHDAEIRLLALSRYSTTPEYVRHRALQVTELLTGALLNWREAHTRPETAYAGPTPAK